MPNPISAQARFQELNQMRMPVAGPAISTGTLGIDMLISTIMMGMGSNFNAVPGKGQGVYDAMLQRQRTQTYLRFMQQSFGNQLIFQRLGGFNTDTNLGKITSAVLGQPNGLMDSTFMRAMNGGNPVKALMGLGAGMTGQTMGMMFGSNTNASEKQVTDYFKGIQGWFYNQRTLNNNDLVKLRAQHNKEVMPTLTGNAGVKDFFKDFISPDGNGFDFDKFRGHAKEYAKKAKDSADKAIIDAYDDVYSRSEGVHDFAEQVKRKATVAKNVNFENTRGYQLDDLTGASLMAGDLGLFTGVKGDTKKTGNKWKNAIGALRAISDLTGAETAQGAMGDLNNLLGNSAVDLGNGDQSKNIELLARRFKGAARAAGISIEAISGILDTTKALTSQHSSLQYQGGIALAETAIKAVNTGTALISTMGPDWTRKNGGTLAVQQTVTETLAENKNEPIVKKLAAWASAIEQSELTPAQKEAKYKWLSGIARGGNFSPQAMNSYINTMAQTLHRTPSQIVSLGDSQIAQQAGMEFLGERDQAGKGLNLEDAARSGGFTELLALGQRGIQGDNFQVHDKSGKLMSERERIMAFAKDSSKSGANIRKLIMHYGLQNSPEFSRWMTQDTPESRREVLNFQTEAAMRFNPVYKYELAKQQNDTNIYAKEAKRLAEKYPKLQAPLLDTIAQSVLGGDLSKGAAAIKDIFMTDEGEQKANDLASALRTMNDEKSDSSVKAAMETISGKKVEAAGFDSLTNVSKKLTISQILQAHHHWSSSQAKQLGMNKDEVEAARKVLVNAGLDSTDVIKNYGDKSFNDVREKLLSGQGIGKITAMATKEMLDTLDKSSQVSFDQVTTEELASPDKAIKAHANELLKTLDKMGLRKGGKTDVTAAINRIKDSKDPDDKDIAVLKSSMILNTGAQRTQEILDAAEEAKKGQGSALNEKGLADLLKSLGASGKAISDGLESLNGLLKALTG